MEMTGNRVVQNLSGTKMQHVEPGDFISHLRTFQGGLELSYTKGKVSPAYTVVTPRESSNPEYYKYALKSHGYISQISSVTDQLRDGQSMRYGEFNLTPLPVPPTAEQLAIADYLDHETAEIDSLCDDLQCLVRVTIERSQSQIHASLSEANGHRESVATTLGKVIHIEGGQVNPKSPDYRDFPLIAPNHIEARTGQITMVETAAEQGAESGKYFIPKGHVVYSKIRPSLMKAAIAPWDCLSSADMYGINSQTLNLANSYILEYLLSPMFESYAVTMSDRVAMPKLNRETLRAAPFVLPPLEIQNTTILRTGSIRNELITLRQDVRQSLSFARERRAALITAAVTGQIDVTARNKPAAEQLEDDIAQGLHREN